ncbi:MAG TPA: hypothetical protein VI336_00255 [Candidatus Saccharimonadales bacterium]|nr:hypothetical protein [Candidatus Saccharimonadales bacterium]
MRFGQILAGLTIAGVVAIGVFTLARNIPGTTNKGMTTGQIEAMQRQLTDAFTSAFSQARQSVSCTTSGSCLVRVTIDYTTSCTTGGKIHTLGGWSGTATPSIASFGLSTTQTITDWRCIGGWIVNGDPYISYSGRVTGTGASTSIDIGQSLGWKAVNATDNARKQSCQTSGQVNYSSRGNGSADFSSSCVPGGSFRYSLSL